jgi:hypothetical protein
MGLAIRVTTAQARLPISPMLLDCVMADAIEPEREEPAPRSRTRQSAGQAGGAAARSLATSATVEALDQHHPREDCSPPPTARPVGSHNPAAKR